MTFSSHRVKCDCLTFTNFSWAKRTNWIKTADYICTFHKQLDSRTSVIEKCQTWNMILFSEMILLRFLAMIGMISLQTKKLICDCGSQIKPKKRNSETAYSNFNLGILKTRGVLIFIWFSSRKQARAELWQTKPTLLFFYKNQ